MTDLSTLVGFGAGGGGGGGGGKYTGSFALDSKKFNLMDENRWLGNTNMDSYFQTLRIRGMDTASKAYFGTNCMTQNGEGGNMAHTFTLFEVDQSTGAIAKVGTRLMHDNSGSTYDYSTYNKTSDEWTGRYTYMGNIPCHGTHHQYSYHQCLAYGTGPSEIVSNHVARSNPYPHGNAQTHNAYVAPGEHRIGGAVRHHIDAYDSGSKACLLEYHYDYSSNSINPTTTDSQPFSTTATSTNYPVPLFNQWDTSNEPYYDAFHSFMEGMYARVRSSGSWVNLGSEYGLSQYWHAQFLSNGNTFLHHGGHSYLIDGSGNISTIAPLTVNHPAGLLTYNWYPFCWNVGEDEWLLSMPDVNFAKFKINPTTGATTLSNTLQIDGEDLRAYDQYYQYKTGFWSRFSITTVNNGAYSATFGTENSNGAGYGRSKLCYFGGKGNPSEIHVATYNIADLVAELTYS